MPDVLSEPTPLSEIAGRGNVMSFLLRVDGVLGPLTAR